MNLAQLKRRDFIKTAIISAASAGIASKTSLTLAETGSSSGNPLPRWRGFNLVDFNSPNPGSSRRGTTDEELKWMIDWGFDFIRLPMAYPRYVEFDRSKHITPDEICKFNEPEVDRIEAFVRKAQAF